MRTRYLAIILFVWAFAAFAADESIVSSVVAVEKEIGQTEVALDLSFSGKASGPKTILVEWPAKSLMLIEPDIEGVDFSVEGDKLALFLPENWTKSVEILFESRTTAPLGGVFNVTMLESADGEASDRPDIVVFEKAIDIPREAASNSDEGLPRSLGLSCTPNPFNASVTISWDLPGYSDACLAVHDILGRKIAELWSGNKSAGTYSTVWNGTNADNTRASSGIYFVKLDADGDTKLFKIQLIR